MLNNADKRPSGSSFKDILISYLSTESIPFARDYQASFTSKSSKIDILVPKRQIGIVFVPWKRLLSTSKITQLETILREANLKKLVVVCRGVAYNAMNYVRSRSLPIQFIRTDDSFTLDNNQLRTLLGLL